MIVTIISVIHKLYRHVGSKRLYPSRFETLNQYYMLILGRRRRRWTNIIYFWCSKHPASLQNKSKMYVILDSQLAMISQIIQRYSQLSKYTGKGWPKMQQWPLDIPQWHITPHPQLSAKIIILYAFHIYRCLNSKFPNHIKLDILERHLWGNNSPILSCGLCVETQTVVLPWRSVKSLPPEY